MSYIWMGWAAGMALALVIGSFLPTLGLVGGFLLGLGMTMLGVLLGAIAEGRRHA